ncbi:MAG: NAD(P)H-dependent oxidoreductase [Candidatus Paracaedibacteraceae bacterium]|nr:NAD(P)H-dependent oxidoreductase [Candidatus Paracaedibacteraceae bacterium]
MKHLIIYGSSGGTSGKTWEIVKHLQTKLNTEVINLSNYQYSYFDYTHANKDDDFKILALKMLEAECIIFITPVYWYSMSGQLKVFFDRLNDLTSFKKPCGRQLKDKSMAFIATGSQKELPIGFEIPFKGTAEYFDMFFQGYIYICTDPESFSQNEVNHRLTDFIERLRI